MKVGRKVGSMLTKMSYDWHVKAYAVYLLRRKGIWLDWSDFDGT